MRRALKRAGFALLLLIALLLAPVTAVELGCRAPVAGLDAAAPYEAIVGDPADTRPEARTWLTYPEWHIVHSAESLGEWLAAGKPPSGYPYIGDVRGFWSGFCALNRVSRGRPGAGAARVMIHVIGVSFTVELLVKAAYENTLGRLSEAAGGWTSRDDAYAARVQRTYARFMHETPWYRFPFPAALAGLWRIDDGGVRHWERRAALSADYGVKAVYARALGGAGNAALGPDETHLRMVVRAAPAALRAIDPRLRTVRTLGGGRLLVDAPRYAAFSDIVGRMADRRIALLEVAGNDDIFVTALLPGDGARQWPGSATLLAIDLPDGRVRLGLSAKVIDLLGLVRGVRAAGGAVEHVYDY